MDAATTSEQRPLNEPAGLSRRDKPGGSSRPLFLAALGLAVVFAAAYAQAPLYYSNQNQYFLHGFAAADQGFLKDDWLVQTLDPTPLFSALIAATVRFLDPVAFYAYHVLALGLYTAALMSLFVFLAKDRAWSRWPMFAAAFVLVHSAAMRWLSFRLLGHDWPWYLQSGVATQYLLGAMFQPSMFGVLLLLAVALFVWDHPYLAALAVATAATMHATYLLPGALLTLGFMAALLRDRQFGRALSVGVLTLLAVLPVVVYSFRTFTATTPELFAEAQDILANVRIPHHARADIWLEETAWLQIAWMTLGIALTWRTRLFLVLAVPACLATGLTIVQIAVGSDTLALLFPWRISTLLMPLATTVMLTRLITIPRLPVDHGAARATALIALVALAAAGLWITLGRHAFPTADEEADLLEFVSSNKKQGDMYFIPVQFPKLTARRGSLSSDFKSARVVRKDDRIIAPDLQQFRLRTGTPIFVDFKSIPYKDREVIEWRNRLRFAEDVQNLLNEGQHAEAIARLRGRDVTHLVWPAAVDLQGTDLRLVHSDGNYWVYQLNLSEPK